MVTGAFFVLVTKIAPIHHTIGTQINICNLSYSSVPFFHFYYGSILTCNVILGSGVQIVDSTVPYIM